MRLSSWIKSGSPWIWLTGGAVSISLLSVLGLMLFIGWKGLTYFWPAPLYMWQTDQGARLVGQLYDQEWVPLSHLHSLDLPLTQEQIERGSIARLSVKIANRERNTSDFISILDIHLKDKTQPKNWAVVDRERNGQFYGRPVGYVLQDGSHAKDVDAAVAMGIEQAESIRQQIHLLITDKVAMLGHQVEQLQHEKRRKELNGQVTKKYLTEYELEKNQLDNELALTEQDIDDLRDKLGKQALIMEDMSGEQVQLPIGQILRFGIPTRCR